MIGYTIQHSIELLEKKIRSLGPGGSPTASQVSFDNTGTGLVATNVQSAINELSEGLSSSNVFPSDNTPIVIGKYGDRDIKRKRITVTTLTTGENAIGSQLPNFDVLIDVHGYIKTSASSAQYQTVNCDINTANFYNGTLMYGTYTPTTGALWVGSPFNGGSAELWIDYVEPVSNAKSRKKKEE